ncbi:MAG: heme ABC transporter ATP-binding protein [Candidatus Protistobacter heckmanni]|nr:heme ABC transporter ATP-binding protein [Candidatus Protistobacter heckmanni]
MEQPRAVLAARNLSYRAGHGAGGRLLVDGVSLRVAPGEFIAILGPNGAGKTTLLRLLAGELDPARGEVELNGRRISSWGHVERARMRAVLPQESKLAFGFSALEVALFGRYPHRDHLLNKRDVDIALAALDAADAGHLAARDFTTLSGGEKSRVQMARVLAQLWEPPLPAKGGQDLGLGRCLLLDEPTAALDLAHQHTSLAAARRFAKEQGAAAVAVLHDLNLAGQYADRLLMMHGGRLVAEGAPADVIDAQTVERVFGLPVRVMRHPDTGLPLAAAAAAAA